jgi:hypothetical protein
MDESSGLHLRFTVRLCTEVVNRPVRSRTPGGGGGGIRKDSPYPDYGAIADFKSDLLLHFSINQSITMQSFSSSGS